MQNLTIHSYNANIKPPAFKGRSRELERVLDRVIDKPQISAGEKELIIDKIKQALQDIFIPGRFIEEGSHNAVYKITKKYAARIPVRETINKDNIGDNFIWGKGVFKNLRNYYGEAIVQLGKLQILKNISPQMPAGVPEHLAQKYNERKRTQYYLKHYLPKFAHISQYSYNMLASDLAKLNEMKFGIRNYGVFDSVNPNNIVSHEGHLMLVDEIYTLCDRSYSNTTAKLLNVFINKATKDYEAPDAGKKIKLVRKIFKKTLLAGVYADLVHANSKDDYRCWELALRKCHLNIQASDLINRLEDFSRKERNPVLRMKMADEFLSGLTGLNRLNI